MKWCAHRIVNILAEVEEIQYAGYLMDSSLASSNNIKLD